MFCAGMSNANARSALILRRANGSRKDGSRQHEDYDVFDGERELGRIYLVEGCGGNDTWFWGVSFRVTKRKSYEYATSLEEARAAFGEEYLTRKGAAVAAITVRRMAR
jgi:hypothetical protein